MARKNLLKGLILPTNSDYKVETDQKNGGEYASIVAYPFDRGFGTTIGNTLRRILLSSIQGFAVSAVMFTIREDGKTTQITNEFESIPGVKEDILEIIASLKKLAIKVDSDNTESKQFVVECKGPGKITGKDFEKSGVTIVNSDLHILTMEKGVDMDMEVQIDFGRGYISCDEHEKQKTQFGVIPVDSIFSPVTRVNYTVEPVRVGQSSEYDKLVLEVYTNGTIKAVDAVAQAACIAQTYLESFVNFDKSILLKGANLDAEGSESISDESIEVLELGANVLDPLSRSGIKTVGDLVQKSEKELKDIEKIGDAAVKKIKEKLSEKGLSLGRTNSSLLKG